MLINSKEYFKHSGVKGMKWGASGVNGSAGGGGSEEEHTPEEILEQQKLEAQQRIREKYGMDEKGLEPENPTSGDLGPEEDKDMSDKKEFTEVHLKPKTKVETKQPAQQKAKIQSIPKIKPQTMMSKVKSLSSKAIAKGKAFIDSLFD